MSKPTFRERLEQKVLIFDGAMGSNLHDLHLGKDVFGSEKYVGCNDAITLFRPDLIAQVHESFYAVGSDVVTTNTFGSNRLKLEEYALGDRTYEINRKAAELTIALAKKFSTKDKPRYVAGDIGPSGMLPSSTDPDLGRMTVDELENIFLNRPKGSSTVALMRSS